MLYNSPLLSPLFYNSKYNSFSKYVTKHFFRNIETIKVLKAFSLKSNRYKKYAKIFEGVLILPFCERESSNR